MTQYITLESKLNTHTLEELEMFDPNSIQVLRRRILSISNKSDIDKITKILAERDSGLKSDKLGKVLPVGIYWDSNNKKYFARRMMNGKRVYIGCSFTLPPLQEKYIKFCKENNLNY